MKFRLLVTTAGYTARYIVSEISFKCQLDLCIHEAWCARISLQVTITTKIERNTSNCILIKRQMNNFISNFKQHFFITPLLEHIHDDVIKSKHFPRYWPFAWGIHRSPVNSPHKGKWCGDLMFSLIWIHGWVNNREAGDLRRHRNHYGVTVMPSVLSV